MDGFAVLSRRKQGFDSPWGRQYFQWFEPQHGTAFNNFANKSPISATTHRVKLLAETMTPHYRLITCT